MATDETAVSKPRLVRLSWDDVMRLCKDLALRVHAEYKPDIVIGIAKGGVIPGVILSSLLGAEFFPMKMSRRRRDRVIRKVPEILVPITDDVRGKSVLLVDETAFTGETFRVASQEAKKQGAVRVKCAALYVRSDAFRPTWYGMESDDFIVKPWDFEVIEDGEFVIRPEYRAVMDRL